MYANPAVDADERAVIETAAILDTTEFRVFNIAYRRWFGRDSDADLMEDYFAAYMFRAMVPPWVRHFTREVLGRARAGTLKAVDYGIRERPLSPQMLRRGRRYIALLLICCLLLLLAAYTYEDLLQLAQNCYFPPCY